MNAYRRALSAMTRRALFMTLKYMEGRLYSVFEGASSAETLPSVTRFFFLRLGRLLLDTLKCIEGRGDTLYPFEVAVAPSMLNSASPFLILHPQYFYPKASKNR